MEVNEFTAEFLGQNVHFYVLKLKQSFLLWIGSEATFRMLAVAMNTRFDSQPSSTHLLGESTNSASSILAQKLAKKTGCQCFVSLNVLDPTLHLPIEQYIIKLAETDPKTFYF